MFSQTLERLRKRRQGIGLVRLVLYGFVWLVRKVSLGAAKIDYRYVLLQSVPSEPMLKGRARTSHEIRTLAGTELVLEHDRDRDGAFSRPPRDLARFHRRVERGDICIAAMRSDKAEGVLWLTFATFDESDVKADFVVGPEQGMAWDSNLFIVENARGGFLFAALWDGANAALREKGYRWVATQTSAFNGPSLQAHQRMGSRRIGRIVYLCLGSIQVTLSTLRPRLHIAARSSSGPVFVIPPPEKAASAAPP